MRNWKSIGAVLFFMLSTQSYVHAADKVVDSHASGKPAESPEAATVQTVYELHVSAKDKSKFLETVTQKTKDADEILRKGECELEKPSSKQKVRPLISFSCKNPNAETDNFFRSIISLTGKGGCARNAGDISLRTYSALLSTCKLKYCCTGLGYPVQCSILNQPCNGCK